MKPRTFAALKKSIAHWESNLKYARAGKFERVRTGAAYCPLCEIFNRGDFTTHDCTFEYEVCPVISIGHGETACRKTPYADAQDALLMTPALAATRFMRSKSPKSERNLFIKYCIRELDFLKSLLPE
jgi:hypothetical protein